MSGEQALVDTGRQAAVQLLGVLVEAQCDPNDARVSYERLKATPLYDPERGQWNLSMSSAHTEQRTDRTAAAQLLGVLVQAQFNPTQAQRLCEQLKATPLYDSKCLQWKWRMSERQELANSDRYADMQLLGVLLEAQFCPEQARELYERLKATPLYDPERRQWNHSMSEGQILEETACYAADQLLGVLAEAQFSPDGARTLYETLLATPLYDPERGQWNSLMSKSGILQLRSRHAYAQLLGVLVEATLLAALPRPLAEAVPPLPIMEGW